MIVWGQVRNVLSKGFVAIFFECVGESVGQSVQGGFVARISRPLPLTSRPGFFCDEVSNMERYVVVSRCHFVSGWSCLPCRFLDEVSDVGNCVLKFSCRLNP